MILLFCIIIFKSVNISYSTKTIGSIKFAPFFLSLRITRLFSLVQKQEIQLKVIH